MLRVSLSLALLVLLTGIDLLVDPDFLKAAKSDFEKRTEGFDTDRPAIQGTTQ